ncbi:Poly [ADP-ribose] polymerase [Yarrowia sp. B02]|nr:Poly [ADP-ribose] polymerase [Yarrowia sp. B02]
MAEQQMLIMFDTKANCNKFYHAQLLDDLDTVEVRYGRVGNEGVKHTYTGGKRKYDQMLRQKRNKGYKDAMIAADVEEGGVTVRSNVIDTALEEIKYLDDMSRVLVTTISQKNIHRITASTSIKFDSDDGLFKTPLGVIHQQGVEEAIRLLGDIEKEVVKFDALVEKEGVTFEAPKKPVSKKRKRVDEEEANGDADVNGDANGEVETNGEAKIEAEAEVETKSEPEIEPKTEPEPEIEPEAPKRRRTRARASKTKAEREAEAAAQAEAEEKAAKAERAQKAAERKAKAAAAKAAEAEAKPEEEESSSVKPSAELEALMANLYSLNEQYFVIIPNKVKNAREMQHLLFNQTAIDEQKATCDALLETLKLIEDLKNKAAEEADKKPSKKKTDAEKTFDVEVKHITDKRSFNRISNMFENSKNEIHGYASRNSKVKNIYKIKLGSQQAPFAATSKKIKCVQELWHGTRLQNILSILGKGLLLPKLSPGQKVGAMFGDGLYFANQSSKSLNYCDGMLWTSDGYSRPETIYMFLASVALGKYFTPEGPVSTNPPEGYDSYWAKAGESGVMNDEIIVFDASQIRLDYLLEIEMRNEDC